MPQTNVENNVELNSSTGDKKTKALNIIKIVLNAIFYIIIVLVLFASIANIRAGKKADGFPNIFGNGYLSVASSSMDGKYSNSFKAGDMVVVDTVNEKNSQKKANKLQIGDIITFYDDHLPTSKKLDTHRIVYILYNENKDVDTIYTMGDQYATEVLKYKDYNDFAKQYGIIFTDINNAPKETKESFMSLTSLSSSGTSNLQEIHVNQLRGIYKSTIKNGGNVAQTISKWGLLIVVLPMVLFLGFEIYLFIKYLREYKKAKYEETHKDEIEAAKIAERERMKEALRKELLEEMNNEKAFKEEKENLKSENDSE